MSNQLGNSDKEKPRFFNLYFNTPVPQKLYHYTNCEAFMGIVQNLEFWASHIKFMNDNTEAELAYNILMGGIKRESKNQVEALTKKVKEAIDAAYQSMDVFIVSFSKNDDDINQWRGYANSVPSYDLIIRTKYLSKEILTPKKISEINDIVTGNKTPADIQTFLLPCLYKDEQHKVLLLDLITKFKKAKTEDAVIQIARQFLFYAPLIKDKSYKDENEWRLIIHLNKNQYEKISFRKGKSYIVPFYKQKINANCIDGVVIGSCPNLQIQHQATKYFLSKQKGIGEIQIYRSSIPFRNW